MKWMTTGALFLTPFVPLFISTSLFFPFITGKAFLFRILVELSFGSWLILALWKPEYRPQKSGLFVILSAFVGFIALSDIMGGHFLKSFWSNFERMEGLVTLLHLLFYFYVLSSFLKTDKIWSYLLNTTILASLFSAGRGFLQLFGLFQSIQSGARIDGTFGNASYMAVYMLFHIFIAAYLLFREETKKVMKWFYGFVILFESFVLFFTQTRGAILALVGGAFLSALLIAIFEKDRKGIKKVAAWFAGGLLLLVALFFLLKDTSAVQSVPPLKRIASISLTERTTSSRFLIWDMAWQGFKEKPLFGWGQENFIFIFEKYYNPGMWNQEPWFDRAHNIFFDWLSAGGIFGLLSYLSIYLFAFAGLYKTERLSVVSKSLFASLLVGYFIHNFFVFDNIGSYLMFILVLSFIHFKTKPEGVRKPAKPLAFREFLTPVAVVMTIFFLYFFNVKSILSASTLLRALSPQEEGVTKNLEYYKKALSYDTYGNQEIREQLLSASSAIINRDVSQELKENFIQFSLDEMQKQVDSNPQSARHQVFMGSFLNRLKLYDRAIPYLEKALELSPRKQPIYFEFITNYLASGNLEKAIDFSRRAYELAPDFDDARIIYAVTLIYGNNFNEAGALLKEKYGEETIADERLASAYFEAGEREKAILSWQKLVAAVPENIQYRTSLAAAYLSGDFREEAILEIQKAIEINPDFKNQGEFFIREIKAGRNP